MQSSVHFPVVTFNFNGNPVDMNWSSEIRTVYKRCKFSPWDFLNFNISASGVAGKGSPIEAGMRQGYCWYLSVSLLVVAFDVPAVAIMMIVCDKPDAKVSHTPRVGANTSDAISALELHVEWRCHAVQAPAIFFAVLFFSFDKELGVAQMGFSEQTG